VYKEDELGAVFNSFDVNQNGRVDFEFVAGKMATTGSGNNPNVNPVFGLTREAPQ
jgi:hypothetical protein